MDIPSSFMKVSLSQDVEKSSGLFADGDGREFEETQLGKVSKRQLGRNSWRKWKEKTLARFYFPFDEAGGRGKRWATSSDRREIEEDRIDTGLSGRQGEPVI
ncbi:hypothetical protein ACLOJK_006030 [Asimina triloba]